jgi:hypothetical protein
MTSSCLQIFRATSTNICVPDPHMRAVPSVGWDVVEFDLLQHLSLGAFTECCLVSKQLRTHIRKPSVQQVKCFPCISSVSWIKVLNCEHAHHPPHTHDSSSSKQPALISLLCVVKFTWLLSAALTALKAVSSRFITMMIPNHITIIIIIIIYLTANGLSHGGSGYNACTGWV